MLAQVVIYYPCALQNLYFQKMNVIPVSLHSLPKEAHTFWLSEVASNLFTMTHYSLWWNRNITLYLSMFWWWLYFSSRQKWKTVPYMQCGRGHQRWYVCLLNWKIRSIKACSVLKKSVRLIHNSCFIWKTDGIAFERRSLDYTEGVELFFFWHSFMYPAWPVLNLIWNEEWPCA